jgi:hypothetical protein
MKAFHVVVTVGGHGPLIVGAQDGLFQATVTDMLSLVLVTDPSGLSGLLERFHANNLAAGGRPVRQAT